MHFIILNYEDIFTSNTNNLYHFFVKNISIKKMDSYGHAFWQYLSFEVPKCLISKDQWSIGSVINKDQAQSLIDYLEVSVLF